MAEELKTVAYNVIPKTATSCNIRVLSIKHRIYKPQVHKISPYNGKSNKYPNKPCKTNLQLHSHEYPQEDCPHR